MNIGGGEAADQLVRMMLSGSEVAVRLSGSALKNVLALSMALAKNHKTISGKVNLAKMLRETRDVRKFTMSPEQYQEFRKRAGKQKLLFSAIRDTDGHGKVVDVIMPVTEIDRANLIFGRIQYLGRPEQVQQEQQEPQREAPSKDRETRTAQGGAPGRTGSPSAGQSPRNAACGPASGGAVKKRISVGTRLARYRAQLDLVQRREPDDE